MNNIDLHCHPSQKTMLTKNTNPREYIEFDTKISILTDETAGDILDSQSSLKQIEDGKFKLIFWSVYTMEREVISVSRIQEAIGNEKKADIDVEYLNKVKNVEINYFDYMKNEWNVMLNEANTNPKLKLIHTIDEMEADKINVFPSLEGAHAFVTSNDDENYIDDEFINRFNDFITTQPLSFITLTHFTDKQLFTHCFALKLMKKSELTDSNFYPTYLSPKGYSDMGERLLDASIAANKAIDIKHTSLLGRLHVYEHIKQAGAYTRIMCSHAGVAGMSYKTFLKDCLITPEENPDVDKKRIFKNRGAYIVKLMYRRKQGPLKLAFNPQTINLYDEDIKSIIEIGGIIGLSMDQRILGGSTFLDRISQLLNYHSDYVTLEGFVLLCQRIGIRPEAYLGEGYMNKLDKELIQIDDLNLEEPQVRGVLDWKKQHRKRVAQSIMHIIHVGLEVSDKPWEHIALGSDYDGLIDAVNCCKTSKDVPKFKKSLTKYFKKLKRKGDYTYTISPEDLVRKIYEENAISFYRR